MMAFDEAWGVIKTPFTTDDDEVIDEPLYSGGDAGDNPIYWSKDPIEALMYSLYGSAVLNDTGEGNPHNYDKKHYPDEQDMDHFIPPPLRETIPTIFQADPHPTLEDRVELDPEANDWYRNYMSQDLANDRWSDEKVANLIQEYIGDGSYETGFTSGQYHPYEAREAHVNSALERLKNRQSGVLSLPKDKEHLYGWSETDNKGEPMDIVWLLLKDVSYQEDQAPTIGSTPIWRAEQAMPDIHERPDYYVGDYQEQHTEMFRDTMAALHQTRGAPYEQLKVYRAIPEHIDDEVFDGSGEPCINAGDWVATSEDYAREHGEAYFDGNYRIVEEMVNAHDLYTHGDSIYEYGWVGHRNPHSGDVIEKAPYHGTTEDRLEQIMREGLKPHASKRIGGEPALWYSDSPLVAANWAESRSVIREGSDTPIVLHIADEGIKDGESRGGTGLGDRGFKTRHPIDPKHLSLFGTGPTYTEGDYDYEGDIARSNQTYDSYIKKLKAWREDMMQRHLA